MNREPLVLLTLFFCVIGLSISSCTAQSQNVTAVPYYNQIEGNGPLPGNYTVAFQEAQCAAKESNSPWYPTLLSYEHHDTNRSKCYGCAQFTGSLTDNNTVYAYKSPDNYYSGSMIATRGMNELYVYGGASGANPMPSGAYVSRVEPGTLKELWRTTLLNINTTGIWSGAGSIESIDGDILAITNTNLVKIDGTNGTIKSSLDLPTGASAPRDSYFNGLSGWSDGTLVMKNLARPPGCNIQGFDAIVFCPNKNETPPSVAVVVDPKTMKVLDTVQLEQMIGGRVTTSEFNGKKYAYLAGSSTLYRYEWDGKNLTLDKSWGPVDYLLPGQTAASAPGIMGDWVILMTNGAGASNTSVSVVAINQANASNMKRIEPMPLQPGQTSYIPSMPALDMANNRIYAMDPGAGKYVGLDFDQNTGNMSVAWSADQKTLSWMILIGPPEHRVLVGTNITSDEPNPVNWKVGPVGANYQEQVQWRDAATGKLLAATDLYGPMVIGMQVWPGYGGLIYELQTDGSLISFQVLPNNTTANNATVNNTAVNNTTVNSTSM
jgi:hypothetical protein